MTILLTDGEIGEIMGDCKEWHEIPYRAAKAQLKKALLGVGKEALKLDNTTYLVPDYKKYREALKEIGL